jgi:hypothetical protein
MMNNESTNETRLNDTEETRREFLKAAGKLAVYTPPSVMLLMRPSVNAIAQSAGLPQNFDGGSQGYDWRDDTEINEEPDLQEPDEKTRRRKNKRHQHRHAQRWNPHRSLPRHNREYKDAEPAPNADERKSSSGFDDIKRNRNH